jgi:glycosyltransferase involved in cell wall biosynthesis
MNASSPKKVLFVHHFSDYTGAAVSMLTLIRHLDSTRYTASVLIVHPSAEPLLSIIRAMGVRVRHLPTRLVWDSPWYSRNNLQTAGWRAFESEPRIAAYLRTERPDIVHINEFAPVSSGITAHELGIPLIWHCRTAFLHTRPFLDPVPRLVRTMVDVAETIICIDEPEAVEFPASKVKIINNPVDFARIDQARGRGSDARKALGIGETDYVVTAPIPLTTHKGAWDFIKACGVAARMAPEISMHFLVVGYLPTTGRRHLLRKWTGFLGPKPDLDRAYDLACRVGIEGSIQLTGFRKDIYEIMDGSDLIVFPTLSRTCGRPGFEAGALRKPFLVTMPNKNTSVVLDGETGLILPEKDPETLGRAIADLARDREKSVRMGQRGFEHVRHNFDAHNHATKIMSVYDRLCAKHRL